MWYDSISNYKGYYGLLSEESEWAVWEQLRYFLTLKYGSPISEGLTRIVWKTRKGQVVKLPHIGRFFSNEREHITPFEYKARTRIIYLFNIPVLFMEWVIEDTSDEVYKIWWVGMVDCGQVGYNRKGELVAFDLGG